MKRPRPAAPGPAAAPLPPGARPRHGRRQQQAVLEAERQAAGQVRPELPPGRAGLRGPEALPPPRPRPSRALVWPCVPPPQPPAPQAWALPVRPAAPWLQHRARAAVSTGVTESGLALVAPCAHDAALPSASPPFPTWCREIRRPGPGEPEPRAATSRGWRFGRSCWWHTASLSCLLQKIGVALSLASSVQ